jgi:class 3 adenylate cyclase
MNVGRRASVIPDEPVRGRTPPPWFRALSGIDRARAFARGLLPWPPLSRLLGLRTTHVAAGTVTMAMPAVEASLASNGQLQFLPLMVAALEGASGTALPGGMDIVPLRFTIVPFRPAWPRPGNLLARARVVNSGNLYVFAEVQVDDPDGRHIAQGSLHSAIQRVEPAPPPPPERMRAVEEPVYETPDPYLRSFAYGPLADLADREDGMTTPLKMGDARLRGPLSALYGFRTEELAVGRAVVSVPASEWFCSLGSDVSWPVIVALADSSGWTAAMTLGQPGQSVVGLDGATRFLRPVRPDGRRIRAETVLTEPVPNLFVSDIKILDADGRLVALHSGSVARLDATQRAGRERKESRRVLATLLFTDIVDSTGHAERLGDARWRALLDEHKLAVRREVSRHNGTEVDTAGDGFFVRFDSPAQAIDAARAARQATAPLGIEIRAGIHTGECELEGNKLAGMAVHIAARIQAAAQPGEILVSSTVKDLAVGSTIRFADKGEQTLKGVPDPWRLWAIAD